MSLESLSPVIFLPSCVLAQMQKCVVVLRGCLAARPLAHGLGARNLPGLYKSEHNAQWRPCWNQLLLVKDA